MKLFQVSVDPNNHGSYCSGGWAIVRAKDAAHAVRIVELTRPGVVVVRNRPDQPDYHKVPHKDWPADVQELQDDGLVGVIFLETYSD